MILRSLGLASILFLLGATFPAPATLPTSLVRTNCQGIQQAWSTSWGIYPQECFDVNYTVLSELQLREFTAKYITVHKNFRYHSHSDEFPDCDDYAKVAETQQLLGALVDRFPYGLVFGQITLKFRDQDVRHQMNWAMTHSPTKIWLYEPQSGEWTDDLRNVEAVWAISI